MEAWPDLKASTIVPEPQVLAEPESCLPKELRNSQTPVWMETTTSLVVVIHFCSAHHAASHESGFHSSESENQF